MYFEHAPLFGGFIISLQHPFHWQIRVIIYIENVPLLGDSGSSYILNMPRHVAIPESSYMLNTPRLLGESGSSYILSTPP